MYRFDDLAGKRFGRLVAVEQSGRTKDRHILWKCECDCGNAINVSSRDLKDSHTRSCGCLQKDVVSNMRLKHGDRDARLYSVWKTMKKRCENERCKSFKWYGGNGVTVCEAWHDYITFKKWALQNGYDEKAEYGKCTIDRIDPCGNYEPGNCRWVSMAEQAKNKRKSAYMGGKND